jgi:hypothetical protein
MVAIANDGSMQGVVSCEAGGTVPKRQKKTWIAPKLFELDAMEASGLLQLESVLSD